MNTKHNSIFRAEGVARRLLLVGATTLALCASVIIIAPAKAEASVVTNDIIYSAPNWTWTARSGLGYNAFTVVQHPAPGSSGCSAGFPYPTSPNNLIGNDSGTGGLFQFCITPVDGDVYRIETYNNAVGTTTGDYDISYFQVSGGIPAPYSPFSPVSNPRIIETYPENGTTTPSTTVDLGADVYNDSATHVRVSLRNLDTQFQYVPFDLPLFASGFTSAGTTTVLQSGLYMASYQMIGSTTAATNIVNTTFRVVGSVWSEAISYDPSLIAASTTSAICSDDEVASSSPFVRPFLQFGCWALIPDPSSIAQFTNLPSLLDDKIPFAYFYDAKDLIASSSQSSASTSIGTVDFFFLNATYTVFSIDDTRSFLSESIWSFIRLLVTYVLYVEWLYLMYRRVMGLLPQANK